MLWLDGVRNELKRLHDFNVADSDLFARITHHNDQSRPNEFGYILALSLVYSAMDTPRYGTKVTCIATSVALILLSVCLTRTITANFAPVYGSVAAFQAGESISYTASSAKLFLIHNDPMKSLLADNFELLCQIAVSWTVLLSFLERIVLFPMSRSLSVDWAMGSLVFPTKVLLFSLIMKLVFDICPIAFRNRALSRDTGWKDVAIVTTLGVTVDFLITQVDDRVGSLLEWLASARPALYLLLTYTAGVITRDKLQIYMALILMATLFKISLGRTFIKYVLIVTVMSFAISMNPDLNPQLSYHGFRVLQRGESITGYLSVLENRKNGLRLLRNDHSILGGTWLLTPERQAEGVRYAESIFSVFYTLEAVRLIELDTLAVPSNTDQMIMDRQAEEPGYSQSGDTKSALVM